MNAVVLQNLEQVRFASEQGRLEDLVLSLKNDASSQREIYDLLEAFRTQMNAQKIAYDEDYVLDVLDRVWGYCAPEARFFETLLS